jgi:hypothetical protein
MAVNGFLKFVFGCAGLILFGGAAVLLVRGLNWVIEQTVPLDAFGISPTLISIIILCAFGIFVGWVSDRPMRKRVKEEKEKAIAEQQIAKPLRLELRSENKETRFHAVNELGKHGSRESVEALCAALVDLPDGDDDFRVHVCDTLVSMGDKAVWELGPLGLMLYYDGSDKRKKAARFHAVSILRKIHSPAAIRELCRALTSAYCRDLDLLYCLSDTLVSIGSPAVEELCLCLNQEDCHRVHAAIVLGGIGDARAIEPLRKRLRCIDNPIRKFVSWAFVEKHYFDGGVRRTNWDWETSSLRSALVKCGWLPTMTKSSAVQSSTPMKKTRKTKILIIALAVFLVTCLFPPWLNVLDVPYHAHQRSPAGHEFFFSPPDSKGGAWSVEVDLKMLFVEWAALAAITGAVWLIVVKPLWLHDDKANRPKKFIPPLGNSNN